MEIPTLTDGTFYYKKDLEFQTKNLSDLRFSGA